MSLAPDAAQRFSPQDAFEGQPPAPGGGDIWCVGPCTVPRVSETCALLLSLSSLDDERIYERVLILTPPGGPTGGVVADAVVAWFMENDPELDPARVTAFVASRIRVQASATTRSKDLIEMLPGADQRKFAVIVFDAAMFTDDGLVSPLGANWAEPLSRFTAKACEAAKASDGYVLLDSGEMGPDSESLAVLEDAWEDCGVLTGKRMTKSDVLKDAGAKIDETADAGDFKTAQCIIHGLDVAEAAKIGLRARVFIRMRLFPQALELLQTAQEDGSINSTSVALKFARLAFRAQGFGLVSSLLQDALARASDAEDLGTVLSSSAGMNENAVATDAAERLQNIDPENRYLKTFKLNAALESGDHRGAAQIAISLGDADPDYFALLADLLEAPKPDYQEILARAEGAWPERHGQSVSLIVREVERRAGALAAFALAASTFGDAPSEPQVRQLILLMGRVLLAHAEADSEDVIGALSHTVEIGLARLAAIPADHSTRAHLGSLLTTEDSGFLGRAVLIHALKSLIEPPLDLSLPSPVRAPCTVEEMRDVQAAMAAWVQNSETLMLGLSTCPASLVPPSFHGGVLWELVTTIERSGAMLEQPDGEQSFLRYVGLIAGFATHLEGPDRDLDIMAVKLASEVLVRANRRQAARDAIEVVLQIAGNDPARVKAAWFAYGAIHRQGGDVVEAALATCAGLSSAAAITPADGWHETLDIIRLLRELGEPEIALSFIDRAAVVLTQMNLTRLYGSRLETLRLQIEQLNSAARGPEAMRLFMDRVIANGRAVLADKDDPSPIGMVLAQTIGALEAGPQKAEGETVLAALIATMSAQAAGRLSRFAAPPEIAHLAALAKELSGARYGRNTIQDVAPLVILARRYLSRPTLAADGGTDGGAAYAVELLADQGLLHRDGGGVETPGALPSDPAAVLGAAQAIAATGLSVTLLGVNDRQALVRVDIVDGKEVCVTVEPPGVFSLERLSEWRRTFPNRYAFIAEEKDRQGRSLPALQTLQAFEQSLAGVGVSDLPPQRVVVISDASLADLPVNLLPCDGVYAAEIRTIAAAPSLTWLARAAERRTRPCGPSVCWVPTADAPADSLLPRIATDLGPLLAGPGIQLNQSAGMPAELQGAELAIVAAHGGLAAPERRFFRGVRDELQRAITGADLAEGVSGSKVVILFVCHGARLDRTPDGQASLGLARQLLDRGCSAVIGSPWPLRGDVPERWLPNFLEAWREGLPVADAAHYANAALGGLPDVRHALHVYGDPLVCR